MKPVSDLQGEFRSQMTMKPGMQRRAQGTKLQDGFALVATLLLMILLTIVAVGLLGLSAISLRGSSMLSASAEAQANARLALMIAIGELQKEMGPDMRVSAESAIFDQNQETESIDGVGQSRWLASYNAWGDWLNASYTPPNSSGPLKISDTYTSKRERMFRRWLISLPEGEETNINAPNESSTWGGNSVVLVGEGSVGINPENVTSGDEVDKVTRAYLSKIGTTGRHAWWIGPENHKARIDMAKNPRSLSTDAWQAAQGDTAEVGVGALSGFEKLHTDATLGSKMVTTQTLRRAEVAEEDVQKRFFDLTAHSEGVLASVRTGQLKKDLSLLFELPQSKLPSPYLFTPRSDIREPSIRPMSAELKAKNPTVPNRHFASWTNMRHFYRMYRNDGDGTAPNTNGTGTLNWSGSKPWTNVVCSTGVGGASSLWDGSNNYWRVPILAKVTFIYSLLSEPSATQSGKFDCYHVYSPVYTFWNPYNTEMRVPDNRINMLTSAYKIWPNAGQVWLGSTLSKDTNALGLSINTSTYLRSGNGSDMVFKPGELKVFSYQSRNTTTGTFDLLPGFDPQAIGGEKVKYGTFTPGQNPGLAIEFSHSYWGGNVSFGNTGGAFAQESWWTSSPGGSRIAGLPMTYSNDWFQRNPHSPDQTHTPITPPGLSNVARWVFTDSNPVPVAFAQIVIKGLSEFNYESINWNQDWRCRNWLQSPPSYFGSGTYMSMDDTIAHTQRLDCPYVTYFGPMSMAEMPKVVGQIGTSAFLGSGSNPAEMVTSAAVLELPSAPIASLAGFSNMRIKPGWLRINAYNPDLKTELFTGNGVTSSKASLYAAEVKAVAYQSGVTGPGIGNSFMHPMLPRDDVYQYIDNSKSQDTPNRTNWTVTETVETKAFNDYWDHVFLLNDALWDDYFVSSLADQTRPGASAAASLGENLKRLVADEDLSNSRYRYYSGGKATAEAKSDLEATDGYLKAAGHLMIKGMFNVNSTSVAAWYALFAGIRERQLVYRNGSGSLKTIDVPTGKIGISRFDAEISDEEMDDPESGVTLSDGSPAWSGVRFLESKQLQKLAEECVKQVKKRGPFLNYSEFINRRLSNDELGLMGALQSAIDYDDDGPEPESINYRYKSGPDYMISTNDLGKTAFKTPEAAAGSRFAGIPGYVIQSDLLKPIGNTLSVRDDTFRIRAYGEKLNASGEVVSRAWCEAIVQRMPEYLDDSNAADEPTRLMDADGKFSENSALSAANRSFGRKFRVSSFRWLNPNEV